MVSLSEGDGCTSAEQLIVFVCLSVCTPLGALFKVTVVSGALADGACAVCTVWT